MRPCYGELGVLADDGDKAQCHICGKWFRHLGNHTSRTHGITPEDYKEAFGLNRQTGLIGPGLKVIRAKDNLRNKNHLNLLANLPEVSTEEKVARMKGKSHRQETLINPKRIEATRRSIKKAQEVIKQKRSNGTYKEGPGPPLWAGMKGRAKHQDMLKDPKYREELSRKISLARGGQVMITCAVCGSKFESLLWKKRKVCSHICLLTLRRRNALRNTPSKRPEVRSKISAFAKSNYKNRQRNNLGQFD